MPDFDPNFDFGFTTVNAEELEEVRQAKQSSEELSETADEYKTRLENLHKAIKPFLNRLKENPEKDYIYWNDRTPVIEKFESYLQNIVDGD